jgi:hypothetical protein
MRSTDAKIYCAFLLTAFLLSFHWVSAQDSTGKNPRDTSDHFDIRNSSFFLPQALPAGKYFQSVSILYVVLPKDWTLDDINAPMLSYAGKYTLSHGFNLQASLATLLISYRANLGPFWNYSVNHLHFGVGYQVAFNFGILRQFGFNTKLIIWEQQPSLSFGYSFRDVAVVLRGDMYWTNAIYEDQGGHVIPHTTSFIDGYSVTGTVEQRLWKNRLLSFGVKVYNAHYHIIAWPAFPVNRYRYWLPEFQLGLSF